MSLEEELEEAKELGDTREAVGAAADIASRALAANDLGLAVDAKQHEVQVARTIGMHNHVVVVTAEAVEMWPRIKALAEIDEQLQRRFVWTFKHGSGSAMDLPEIPLSTVRELFAVVDDMLGCFGRGKQALWELEARLAYIEGDDATLRDRVEKITPLLGMWSYISNFADCPGCSLSSFAGYLGPDADADTVDAILAPILEKRPFPADASHRQVLSLLYGDENQCENAATSTPIARARAYARAGRIAEARVQADLAVSGAEPSSREWWLRAQVARADVAVAAGDRTEAEGAADAVAQAIDPIEDPYEQLDALVALHQARRWLEPSRDLGSVAERALSIARRVDARLPRPRHVVETERRLGQSR